jgi:hypothetical protein
VLCFLQRDKGYARSGRFVHEYPGGELAVYWGPHRLADNAAGGMVQPAQLVASTEQSRVGMASRDEMQRERAYGRYAGGREGADWR